MRLPDAPGRASRASLAASGLRQRPPPACLAAVAESRLAGAPSMRLGLTPTSWTQGGWETDETVVEAAARESLEEAGVRGELQARPALDCRRPAGRVTQGSSHTSGFPYQELGRFDFHSKSCRCEAHVFVMRVTEARARPALLPLAACARR